MTYDQVSVNFVGKLFYNKLRGKWYQLHEDWLWHERDEPTPEEMADNELKTKKEIERLDP